MSDQLDAFRAFRARRLSELKAQGFSGNLTKQVSADWKAFKAAHPGMQATAQDTIVIPTAAPTTQVVGQHGAPPASLSAMIPLVTEMGPDLAASWDLAQGVLDFLRDNAVPSNDTTALRRKAAAAFARAKGVSVAADEVEYRMGQAIGETLLLVMAHEGMTAKDWTAMQPPQLGAAGGLMSGTMEFLLGAAGVAADLDNDGSQVSAGGAAAEAAQGVLNLFE